MSFTDFEEVTLHYDMKSSEQFQLNRSSPQWYRKYIYNTAIFDKSAPQTQLIASFDFLCVCTYG